MAFPIIMTQRQDSLSTEPGNVIAHRRYGADSFTKLTLIYLFLQDHPLLSWTECIDNYLAEFLCLEGRGNACDQVKCAVEGCETDALGTPFFGHRCENCQDCSLYCLHCTLESHRHLPFHQIQVSGIPILSLL